MKIPLLNRLARRRILIGLSSLLLRPLQAQIRPPIRPVQTEVDWNSIGALSQEAFRVAVNEWIARATIRGGTIKGPTAVITPGSLASDVNLAGRMTEILAGRRAPPDISIKVANVLAAAWNEWATGFQQQIPGAYPTFAAVPGRAAPRTRSVVSPALALGNSIGEASLTAAALANRLVSALATDAATAERVRVPMQSLATWVANSFQQWKSTTTLTGIAGSGSVPTFAPPYVPVGPVTSGDNISVAPLFTGPQFGIARR